MYTVNISATGFPSAPAERTAARTESKNKLCFPQSTVNI